MVTLLTGLTLMTVAKLFSIRGRFGRWSGLFGLRGENLPVEVFGEIDRRIGGGSAGRHGELGGPKKGVHEHAAPIRHGPARMEIAAGEAEASTAVGAFEGPGDGFGPAGLRLGRLRLAGGIGQLGREEGGDAVFGTMEVV